MREAQYTPPRKIIWTRSVEDWSRDHSLFASYSGEVVHLPCLVKESLSVVQPQGDLGQLIFTSPRAVREAIGYDWLLQAMQERPCHCFGAKTHKALQQQNAAQVVCHPVNTSRAMLNLLPVGQSYTYIGPLEPAFDLAAALVLRGDVCNHLAIYRTVSISQGGDEQLQQLSGGLVVCFASPSAVRGFEAMVQSAGMELALHAVVVMGETTAALAQVWADVHYADEQSVAGLAVCAMQVACD